MLTASAIPRALLRGSSQELLPATNHFAAAIIPVFPGLPVPARLASAMRSAMLPAASHQEILAASATYPPAIIRLLAEKG
jgi:hypothetical protein